MCACRIQSQKELRLQSRKGFASLLPPNVVCWLGILVVGSGAGNPGITIGNSGVTKLFAAMATGTGTASSGGAADAYTGKAAAMCRRSTASRATTESIAAGPISAR